MRRSLLLASGERYATAAIGLIATAVTARLLTPADFGVAVLGATAVGLAETLRDFGTSTFIIQKRDLTRSNVRTAFTVTLLLSLLLAGALLLAARPIARFYGDDGIQRYLDVVAIGFLIGPFVSPITALLRREMAFGTLALLSIAGASINAVAVVTLAWLGFAYMSFAWALIVSGVAGTCLTLWVRSDPGMFRPELRGWREAAAFAGYDTVSAVLNRAWDAMPYLVFGRVLGVEAVGLYNRAALACSWPEKYLLAGLSPVVLPAFSAHARDGGDLKQAYLRALEFITVVQWPALILLAVLAHPVVLIMFGAQWLTVVPLVQIIAIALLGWFPAYLTYPVLVASGRIRDTLSTSLISLPLSALVLLVAAHFGLKAVALSMFVTVPLQVSVALWFVRRCIHFTAREFAGALSRSVVVAAFAAIGPVSVSLLKAHAPSIAEAGLASALALVGWLLGLRVSGHPMYAEILQLRVFVAERLATYRQSRSAHTATPLFDADAGPSGELSAIKRAG